VGGVDGVVDSGLDLGRSDGNMDGEEVGVSVGTEDGVSDGHSHAQYFGGEPAGAFGAVEGLVKSGAVDPSVGTMVSFPLGHALGDSDQADTHAEG
jgi:hypothetical protein